MTEVESGAPRPDATTVTVGVPAESAAGERRVALVPKAVAGLTKSGVSVVVQSGAGDFALTISASRPFSIAVGEPARSLVEVW